MPDELRSLEAYLHAHIPLTRAMQVQVVSVDQAGVRLRAPIEPNINHRNTVFGGSAATLAILSGWTLIHTRLRASGFAGRIVIQRNSVDYHQPIHSDFEAFCPAPDPDTWGRFAAALHRRGRARIILTAELSGDDGVAGGFVGAYMAMVGEGD